MDVFAFVGGKDCRVLQYLYQCEHRSIQGFYAILRAKTRLVDFVFDPPCPTLGLDKIHTLKE